MTFDLNNQNVVSASLRDVPASESSPSDSMIITAHLDEAET